MDFRELFRMQHARAHTAEVGGADFSVQDTLLRDVTEEQIRQRPSPGFNSLAWLLWHMTRAEDIGINVILMEQPQVLDEGDWANRLNLSRRDLGSGMTSEEVDEFVRRANVAELLAYRAAVRDSVAPVLRRRTPLRPRRSTGRLPTAPSAGRLDVRAPPTSTPSRRSAPRAARRDAAPRRQQTARRRSPRRGGIQAPSPAA
jgi:hypothetical protein